MNAAQAQEAAEKAQRAASAAEGAWEASPTDALWKKYIDARDNAEKHSRLAKLTADREAAELHAKRLHRRDELRALTRPGTFEAAMQSECAEMTKLAIAAMAVIDRCDAKVNAHRALSEELEALQRETGSGGTVIHANRGDAMGTIARELRVAIQKKLGGAHAPSDIVSKYFELQPATGNAIQ